MPSVGGPGSNRSVKTQDKAEYRQLHNVPQLTVFSKAGVSNDDAYGRTGSTDWARTRPLVGTPVPAVTRTCSTFATWFTAVPRT